jgi:hypothetical protein
VGSAAGFIRPGLQCEKCGLPFSLFLGTNGAESQGLEEDRVARLPDPFEAKCWSCQHVATYPKSAIRVLVAVGGP